MMTLWTGEQRLLEAVSSLPTSQKLVLMSIDQFCAHVAASLCFEDAYAALQYCQEHIVTQAGT